MTAKEQGSLPTVLLVHNRYRIPGGEDTVYEAERALLEAHGHRVICYERSNAETDGSRLAKLLLPFTALYSLRTAREVRAIIRREKVDIVHVHNTLLMVSPSVFRAARKEGVPVVHTLHNFRLLCPNGIFLREKEEGFTICEDCPNHGLRCAVKHRCYRGSKAQSLIVAAMLRLHRVLGTWKSVWLLAITEFDREKFLQYNAKCDYLTPERLLLKPHPVAGGEKLPLPWGERRGYLFAGRLEELKGIRPLLAAWKNLPDQKLLVAGDGPLEGWCRDYAAQNGLNVEFLGRLPHDELAERQRQARAAIVPSLCYESFGLAAAESLMNGTPVLGSDLGNTGAFIDPGVNGLRFTPGDAASIAEAVRRMDAMGADLNLAAIQKAAAARFAPEENYRALLTVYREILNKEGKTL